MLMEKWKNKTENNAVLKRRLTALFLALIMMFTVASDFVVYAVSSSGVYDDVGNLANVPAGILGNSVSLPIRLRDVNGNLVYCMQPGIGIGAEGADYPLSSSQNLGDLSAYHQRMLSYALYYGYDAANEYASNIAAWQHYNPQGLGKYVATQYIVWEILTGYTTDHVAGLNNLMSNITWWKEGSWEQSAIDKGNWDIMRNTARDFYSSVWASIDAAVKVPSFATMNDTACPTYVMKYNQSTGMYSITLTDTYGLASGVYTTYSNVPSGVTYSRSGNTVTFTSSSPLSGAKKITAIPASGSIQATQLGATLYRWTWNKNSDWQDLVEADGVQTRAVYGYFNLQTEADGTLQIRKTDSFTSNQVGGAVYGVYSNNACTNEVTRLTTAASGWVAASLKPGTYYIKEIAAPNGYDLNGTVYPVTVAANTTTSQVVTDAPSPGTLQLRKTDANSGALVGGAVYGVYSNNACTNEVARLTTTASGWASVSLNVGTYYIKEISAPSGYQLNSAVDSVTVTANTTVQKTVTDSPYPGKLTIYKKDSSTGALLSGATFGIYSNAACTNLVKEVSTGASGSVTIDNLPASITYYVKELSAPSGYELNTSVESVKINPAGTHSLTITDVASGYIEIKKVGINSGKPIGSAEYTIYTDSACTNAVTTLKTDVYGYAKSTGLAPGIYYIKETKAPVGYELVSGYERIVVESGKTSTAKEVNQEPEWEAEIEITKVSPSGGILPGATMEVYQWSVAQNKYVFLKNMTDRSGVYTAVGLSYTDDNLGKFKVVETKNPVGYTGSYSKEFTMDLNQSAGSSQTFSFTDTAVNEPTKIRIKKVDEAGNPLKGCGFYLYDVATGKKVAEWRTNDTGIYELNGVLEAGKSYRLEEWMSPGDYYWTDDITFTVEDTSNWQEITAVNKSGYRCYITLDKKIKIKDIVFEHGDPTFLFKVDGTDYESVYHEFYRVLSLSEDILEEVITYGYYSDMDAGIYVELDGEYVLMSTYVAVKPGTYRVSEEKTSRYSLSEVVNVLNAAVNSDGKSATCVMGGLSGIDEAEVLFINEKTEQRNYSHSSVVTNRFWLKPAIS